jgi:hypothetical protein
LNMIFVLLLQIKQNIYVTFDYCSGIEKTDNGDKNMFC